MNTERLGEQLSAYLDGELTEEETAVVEQALRDDAGARRLLDELRQMAAGVESLPRHVAPASILKDVQFQLERSELLGDSIKDDADRGGRGMGGALRWAMAATLGIAAIGALWAVVEQHEPINTEQVASRSTSTLDSGPAELSERLAMVEAEEAPRAEGKEGQTAKRSRRSVRGREIGDQTAVPRSFSRRGLGQPAAEAGSPGDKRTNDAGSPRSVEAIADARDVDAKLAQGLTADSIRQHAFGNETVRLEIRAIDEASRDRIERQLLTALGIRDVVDLGVQGSDTKPTQFYYRGQVDTNYRGTGRRQVLVRARVGKIEAMLGELGYDRPGTPDDVTLVVNKFRFQGRGEARETLRRLVPKSERAVEAGGEYGPVAVLPLMGGSGSDRAIENLARGFGVDPSMLKNAKVFMDLDVVASRDSQDADGGRQAIRPVDERDEGASPKRESSRQAGAQRKSGARKVKKKAIRGAAGREPASVLKDRPTLVDRRMAALERQVAQARQDSRSVRMEERDASPQSPLAVAPAVDAIRSADRSAEPVITLVVDLMLPEPTNPATAQRVQPRAKRKAHTKTPPKTGPKTPNATSKQ